MRELVDDEGAKLEHLLEHVLRPPEKPRQLARTSSRPSPVLKSWMACAVLYAESGNQTPPACICFCGFDSRLALGSTAFSTVRFSMTITPMGTPPGRGRRRSSIGRVSVNEPASSSPGLNAPSTSPPQIIWRGSYGVPASR